MNRHRVWSLALASVVFIQLFSSAQGDAGQGSTEDVDFATAIAKIAASAEHHFTDIAGAKGAGEYKTSLRIKYRGTTFGGLIRPFPGGGWSCTYPVLITLDKTEADAAFTEWTSALSSVFGNGQPLSSIAESESRAAIAFQPRAGWLRMRICRSGERSADTPVSACSTPSTATI